MKIEDFKEFGIDCPNKGKLIVDINSTWCEPCKLISLVLENFRDQGLINLVQINIDKNRDLGSKLNIYSVPTLLFFKDGELLEKNIAINGEVFVKNGVMVGAIGDLILEEIIKQM
jgi:thioredoxin 1